MRYFLIEEQEHESHDTNGCGCRLIEIMRAKNIDDALRLANAVIEAESEFTISDARLLVVADEKDIDLLGFALDRAEKERLANEPAKPNVARERSGGFKKNSKRRRLASPCANRSSVLSEF